MPGQKKEVNAPGKFHSRRQGRSEILTNSATRPDWLGQTLSKEFDKIFTLGSLARKSRPTAPRPLCWENIWIQVCHDFSARCPDQQCHSGPLGWDVPFWGNVSPRFHAWQHKDESLTNSATWARFVGTGNGKTTKRSLLGAGILQDFTGKNQGRSKTRPTAPLRPAWLGRG